MKGFTVGFYSMFNRGEWDMERPILEPLGAKAILADEKSEKELLDMAGEIDALLIANNNLTAEHIRKMKKCRIIGRQGVGMDSIDLEAAREAGIVVCNVPDCSQEEVADHATAMMLTVGRNIPFYNHLIKVEKIWDHRSLPVMKKVTEMKVFLVGFGKIGQLVAEKIVPLFGEVLAYDPFMNGDAARALGVKVVDSLEEGLKIADIASLHIPLTEDSHHIINAKTLRLMKPDAYLVNLARGPHVDRDALHRALEEGVIAGAALDVLEGELEAEKGDFSHPIFSNPKVVFTPHVGWYSSRSRMRSRVVAAQAVADFFQGKELKTRVV